MMTDGSHSSVTKFGISLLYGCKLWSGSAAKQRLWGLQREVKRTTSSSSAGTNGGREDIEKIAFTCRWTFFECPTIVTGENSPKFKRAYF
jgi:hypothetical protein